MKTAVKYRIALILIVILAAALAVMLMIFFLKPQEVDPHEGQVYIDDGFGMVWMTPLEGVEPSVLGHSVFKVLFTDELL